MVQVTPPPGYDAKAEPFPVQVPMEASGGMQIEVVLPALEPESIPMAQEVNSPNQVLPVGVSHEPDTNNWILPPEAGSFDNLLAQTGSVVRGERHMCPVIAFSSPYARFCAISCTSVHHSRL